MVSTKGGKHGFVYKSRHAAYRSIMGSKEKKARIANAGVTKAGRSRMAKKAARTRKRRKG
jgi:hypothetical protein